MNSFWSTLPGILTAVGSLIVAVTGLVAGLHSAGIVGSSQDTQEVQPVATLQPQSTQKIDGTWKGVVTYDWGPTHTEEFMFNVDGDEVLGTASFLGTKRGVLDGKLSGNKLTFNTKTRELLGDEEKETVHHYGGRISGDEIQFIMQTEGGFSDHPPVEFTAKRMP